MSAHAASQLGGHPSPKVRSRPLDLGLLRSLDWLVKALIVIFMLGPVVLVLVLSFSAEHSLSFPPHAWGWTQYHDFFDSPKWVDSIWKSLEVSIPAAALATAVGLPAALAIERSRLPLRGVLRVLGMAPLVLPGVAYALALYTFYVKTSLVGTVQGLVLADSMLALPFVLVVVGAGLRRIPRELELVAMSLGASRLRATWGITFRLLAPAIAAAFILGFITSFDEAVLVNFLGGSDVTTLPKAIYDSLQTELQPLITAIASVLMVTTGACVLAVGLLRRGERS